jgi:ABC-2 type transport system permease protein
VRTEQWSDTTATSGHGVMLGVYYHPDHDRNLEAFVRSMKASLSYYTKHFGPYESSALRIVEIPRYEKTARAHPNTVAFSEHAFFARTNLPIDQLFFTTAHEIAHQWWGSIDANGSAGFLSGMLANYSAMMATEYASGPAAAQRLYAFHMDQYFSARASGRKEIPLVAVEAEPLYRKGLLAMYLMRAYVGEAAVDTALRRLIQNHREGAHTYATPRDLANEFRAVTPESLQHLITDVFETVTVWDLRIDRAVIERTGDAYRLILDVSAKKLRPDSAGTDIEVPMNDVIDIAVFGAAPGEPLYLKQHRIRDGIQTINITVSEKPVRVEIDPFRKLFERIGRDNVKSIDVQPGSSSR